MVSSPSYHYIKHSSKIYKNYKKECNVRDLSRLHLGTFAGNKRLSFLIHTLTVAQSTVLFGRSL